MFENDLEQANSLIARLKSMNKSASQPPPETEQSQDKKLVDKLTKQINDLKVELEESNAHLDAEKRAGEQKLQEKLSELESQDKMIDNLTLELKQCQQSVQQEKMMQMQEQKQERQEMAKLKMENTELKIKLDEKISEIKLLGDQISDLNANINGLKSNDENLFGELKQKTEEFVKQLDMAEEQIGVLKKEKETLIEQVIVMI
jgi:chromosome segregation ATPase